MKRKTWGGIVLCVGVLLLAAGLVLMLAIVPSMKKLPGDTNVTRHYTGTMAVLLNPKTFEFMKGLPVDITRHLFVEKTDGNLALVDEDITMTSQGTPLAQQLKRFIVDRKTNAEASGGPADWQKLPGVVAARQGVVFAFPPGVEKKDYTGWSDDYMATVPMKFVDVIKGGQLDGMYHFTSVSPAKPIDPSAVAAMGLPTSLPVAQVAGLLSKVPLDPKIAAMVQGLLAQSPLPTLPLAYFYAYEGEYWVDPVTGDPVRTTKHELRTVGLPDALLAATPLGQATEAQKAAMRVPVYDLTYDTVPQTITDALSKDEKLADKLSLWGTTVPLIGIIAGALLAIAGGIVVTRKAKA
jgi:hypothetical protein